MSSRNARAIWTTKNLIEYWRTEEKVTCSPSGRGIPKLKKSRVGGGVLCPRVGEDCRKMQQNIQEYNRIKSCAPFVCLLVGLSNLRSMEVVLGRFSKLAVGMRDGEAHRNKKMGPCTKLPTSGLGGTGSGGMIARLLAFRSSTHPRVLERLFDWRYCTVARSMPPSSEGRVVWVFSLPSLSTFPRASVWSRFFRK